MQLQTIRAMLKESVSLQDADDARVDEMVNEAVVDFARDTLLGLVPFSFVTVKGQSVYRADEDAGVGSLVRFIIIATGGTLDVGLSGDDATLDWDATAAEWETALEALSTDLGEVDVTIGNGDGSIDQPIVVEVRQQYGTAIGVTDDSSLTGNGAEATSWTRREDPAGVLFVKPAPAVLQRYGYRVHSDDAVGVVLDPVPQRGGDTLTGHLLPRPAVLSQDTDTLPFDREWDRAIRYRAMQLLLEWDRQDPTEIQMFEGKYEGEVLKARRRRNRAVIGGVRGLRPSSSVLQSPVTIIDNTSST